MFYISLFHLSRGLVYSNGETVLSNYSMWIRKMNAKSVTVYKKG
jgi:hypothetical protein